MNPEEMTKEDRVAMLKQIVNLYVSTAYFVEKYKGKRKAALQEEVLGFLTATVSRVIEELNKLESEKETK